jgi:hypothetical protein
MSKTPKDDEYEGEEAQRRFEEALKAGLKTPPQPLKDKPLADKKASPSTKRRAKKKRDAK